MATDAKVKLLECLLAVLLMFSWGCGGSMIHYGELKSYSTEWSYDEKAFRNPEQINRSDLYILLEHDFCVGIWPFDHDASVFVSVDAQILFAMQKVTTSSYYYTEAARAPYHVDWFELEESNFAERRKIYHPASFKPHSTASLVSTNKPIEIAFVGLKYLSDRNCWVCIRVKGFDPAGDIDYFTVPMLVQLLPDEIKKNGPFLDSNFRLRDLLTGM